MSPTRRTSDSKGLVLGWTVTSQGDPEYWLGKHPRPGRQEESDLVVVPAATMAHHTAIVAQSGSGKSAFLGRLVEELMLKTRARCVILDPNADFRRVAEAAGEILWRGDYNRQTGLGRLATETTRMDFDQRWQEVRPKVATYIHYADRDDHPIYEPLTVWWPSLDADVLAFDLNSQQRSELRSCHYLVQETAELRTYAKERQWELGRLATADLHVVVERLGQDWRIPVGTTAGRAIEPGSRAADDRRVLRLLESIAAEAGLQWSASLPWEDSAKELLGKLREGRSLKDAPLQDNVLAQALAGEPMPNDRKKSGATEKLDAITAEIETLSKRLDWIIFKSWLTEVVTVFKYVSEAILHFYVAKARECSRAGLLADAGPGQSETRLKVVDLPSVDSKDLRLLVVNALVASEWVQAKEQWSVALALPPEKDRRVPTFIVVDEAHNLVPASPQNPAEEALRGQFRRIAAEGRKYGLFLVLVTQRPDKLDPITISECENVALMRLSTQVVLDQARSVLGLDHVPEKMLQKCLEFGKGRALLAGPWAGAEPRVTYCAARRTVEGGRNLRPEYWGVPGTAECAR